MEMFIIATILEVLEQVRSAEMVEVATLTAAGALTGAGAMALVVKGGINWGGNKLVSATAAGRVAET